MSTPQDLHLAFDVGHSSIGWAVLQTPQGSPPALLGCGSVIFPADDCLASQRRGFRRQRRHIRATRLRIARVKTLLESLAVLTDEQLSHVTSSSPWLLAARVLRGGKLLTWAQLWDVLRWYAHNRGYDGNKAWSRQEADVAAEQDDAEKVQNARALYEQHGTRTMCETWCAVCGIDPLGGKTSCHLPGDKRPKALNAAFPREDLEREVRALLDKHVGALPKLDAPFVAALMEDWQAVPCPAIHLPKRFRGGLLFGQLVPRFDNRIIARCMITHDRIRRQVENDTGCDGMREAEKLSKVPSAACPDFLRFRWVMQLANVLVQTADPRQPRRLAPLERNTLDEQARAQGALTKGEFKKAVRKLTGGVADNLDQMLLHPDAEKALVVDPVQRILVGSDLASFFATLPRRLQKRVRGQLRRRKRLTLQKIHDWLLELGDATAFDAELTRQLDSASIKRTRKTAPPTRAEILAKAFQIPPVSGRAPYTREVMAETVRYVLGTDRHPAEKGGPLFRDEHVREAELSHQIDERTNNHLVRHRLRLLIRLHLDLLAAYAGPVILPGLKKTMTRVARVTIEVNREVKELSGKTAKQVAQDLGLRLANFKSVSTKLEKQLAGKTFNGQPIRITPGLIRKARIAEDLGWKCPYTGKEYDILDLVSRRVDKDHIVPRADRASDSLDSLVITFAGVNKMKKRRTAVLFVEEDQSKAVPGEPQLSIKPLSTFLKDIEALETFKGHDDDIRRKRNRKRLLLLRDYVEKEFTPRDLTQTSQLVRLAAQALENEYVESDGDCPPITSLPGSVTSTVRKAWRVLGCLEAANPQVVDPDTGDVRTKTEIRDITHLHHALDASVLGFASIFLPGQGRDGEAWKLLVQRRLNAEQQARARELFKNYVEFEEDGTLRLIDLPKPFKDQIRQRLAERRVVQHLPAELAGLHAELNAWRVVGVKEGEATLRQRMRQPDGTRSLKQKKEKVSKLIGLQPGKLQKLKAALVIADNFGVALDPEPEIIPFHKVWNRLRDLQKKNGGKTVRVLRNGMLIRIAKGDFIGTWRICSVKNDRSKGLLLDLAAPDKVGIESTGQNQRRDVRVRSLLKDGLALIGKDLAGIDASPVS